MLLGMYSISHIGFFNHNEHLHVKSNFVHHLYQDQIIKILYIETLKILLMHGHDKNV